MSLNTRTLEEILYGVNPRQGEGAAGVGLGDWGYVLQQILLGQRDAGSAGQGLREFYFGPTTTAPPFQGPMPGPEPAPAPPTGRPPTAPPPITAPPAPQRPEIPLPPGNPDQDASTAQSIAAFIRKFYRFGRRLDLFNMAFEGVTQRIEWIQKEAKRRRAEAEKQAQAKRQLPRVVFRPGELPEVVASGAPARQPQRAPRPAPQLPPLAFPMPDITRSPIPQISAPPAPAVAAPAPRGSTRPTRPPFAPPAVAIAPFLLPYPPTRPSPRPRISPRPLQSPPLPFVPTIPAPIPPAIELPPGLVPGPLTPPIGAPDLGLTPNVGTQPQFSQPPTRSRDCPPCEKERERKRKKGCTNPVVSRRTRTKDGRVLRTVTREVICQSSSANSRSARAPFSTTSSRAARLSSFASLLW